MQHIIQPLEGELQAASPQKFSSFISKENFLHFRFILSHNTLSIQTEVTGSLSLQKTSLFSIKKELNTYENFRKIGKFFRTMSDLSTVRNFFFQFIKCASLGKHLCSAWKTSSETSKLFRWGGFKLQGRTSLFGNSGKIYPFLRCAVLRKAKVCRLLDFQFITGFVSSRPISLSFYHCKVFFEGVVLFLKTDFGRSVNCYSKNF